MIVASYSSSTLIYFACGRITMAIGIKEVKPLRLFSAEVIERLFISEISVRSML
jgi:hypothetical protein